MSYYFDLISKRKKGIVAALLRAVLYLLSILFAVAGFLRRKFHKKGYRPKAFTISVGNIVAGGTGKTPFTIYLAKQLQSVAIVMRGYKAECEKYDAPYLFTKEAPVAVVGDEACLIARNVPHALIICGKSKAKSAQLADRDFVIIDDGMQHIALERDVEIVLIDSQNPFGYGYLLPRGLLREPVSALKRADLIVITCRNGVDIDPASEAVIKKHTQAPICKVRYSPVGFFDLQDRPHTFAKGTKVAVACAIAKPEQFLETLAPYGLDIVSAQFFSDHDTIDLNAPEDATCIICTEKDMVKLEKSTLPVYWLKVELEVFDIWNAGNAAPSLQKLIKNLHLEPAASPA
ncbi:MAG: tetraacyldisaccharide 4'-kinase [Verrucomicrobia bacterium]|nr:tetraacyldisaccharide 4'-kinase [Verrucomicrobiota bacterium]